MIFKSGYLCPAPTRNSTVKDHHILSRLNDLDTKVDMLTQAVTLHLSANTDSINHLAAKVPAAGPLTINQRAAGVRALRVACPGLGEQFCAKTVSEIWQTIQESA